MRDETFARMVAQEEGYVRAFLRRLCGDEADDIAQEAFVTAWERIDRLREGASFRSFVCGIAYRKALSSRRAHARSASRDFQWLGGRAEIEQPTHDARLSADAALSHLPPDQRAAILLCLAGDFTHAETAGILRLPLGTIKTHITKGRAKLAALMGAEDA
jgi:RNA polymerase sigma factor (sigma-70 family)